MFFEKTASSKKKKNKTKAEKDSMRSFELAKERQRRWAAIDMMNVLSKLELSWIYM
jgi:hypothetical protein